MLPEITLAGETDLDGFRAACRRLIAAQVEPGRASWFVAGSAAGDLFAARAGTETETETGTQTDAETVAAADTGAGADAPAISIPPAFLSLVKSVLLHRDPNRFGLLYRLLWRLQREPGLRHDPLDADVMQAQHLAQAVRRDMHKMKAFVRFRRIETADAAPQHIAWFEPGHHIVDAVAPFFVRRFTAMHWAILTPERCVRWRGQALEFGPGASRDQAPPADAGERLWLTYYEHIFNPARLKLKMMQKEMPRRYWKNLPEAVLISPLSARAAERSAAMIAQPAADVARRVPIASLPARRPPLPPLTARPADLTTELATDLASLRTAIDRCRACPIGAQATQGVPGEGPAGARLMVVGEQPGDHEDLRGRPFVGPAGQLFDRALAQLGWPREQLFITNAVKHFKFELNVGLRGQRRIHKTPAQQEAAACLDWLEHEIALVKPAAIIALGATAARSLLVQDVAVMRDRGGWFERGDGRPVLVTLHPAALLRMAPAEQEAAFDAWLADLAAAAPFALENAPTR